MTKWIVVAGRQIFRLALFFSFPQSFPLTVQSPQTIHHARFGAHTKKHYRTTNIATRTVKRREKRNIYIIVLRHLAVFKCRFVSRITRDLNRCHAGLEKKNGRNAVLQRSRWMGWLWRVGVLTPWELAQVCMCTPRRASRLNAK